MTQEGCRRPTSDRGLWKGARSRGAGGPHGPPRLPLPTLTGARPAATRSPSLRSPSLRPPSLRPVGGGSTPLLPGVQTEPGRAVGHSGADAPRGGGRPVRPGDPCGPETRAAPGCSPHLQEAGHGADVAGTRSLPCVVHALARLQCDAGRDPPVPQSRCRPSRQWLHVPGREQGHRRRGPGGSWGDFCGPGSESPCPHPAPALRSSLANPLHALCSFRMATLKGTGMRVSCDGLYFIWQESF